MPESEYQKDAPPRRRFFAKAGAGVALLTLAPGVRLAELAMAASDDEPVSDAHRWGLWVDTSRCADGCDKCVSACNEEHGLAGVNRPETDAQWIRKVDLRDEATGRELSLPLMCQHCEEPPCVDVCPTGASFRREDGIVLVDKHMMACPFHARSFIHEDLSGQKTYSPRGKGTVESCTLCVHRVDQDRTPACVEACTDAGHHALVFGDLNDQEGRLAKTIAQEESQELRPDLQLNTAVRYSGV